jgi:hypothetical protein
VEAVLLIVGELAMGSAMLDTWTRQVEIRTLLNTLVLVLHILSIPRDNRRAEELGKHFLLDETVRC